MLLALIALFFVVIFSMKYCSVGFWPDYIAKSQCNVVKGIFILLVFLSLFASNIAIENRMVIDHLYFSFQGRMGQLIVALFLFYSGYGVMKSISIKGKAYIDSMPKRRVLKTILNFDMAVFLFVLLSIIVDADINVITVAFSLIGWDSVRNDHWYIFVIVLCYVFTWCIARMNESMDLRSLLLLSGLVIIFACVLSAIKSIYWYDTVMCYVLGVWYSRYERQLVPWVQKRYWGVVSLLMCVVLVLTVWSSYGGVVGNLRAMAFSLLCVMGTMKLRIDNRFLCWCGAMLFPLYIYQRLPMIVVKECLPGLLSGCWIYISMLLCFGSMLGFGRLYHRWQIVL